MAAHTIQEIYDLPEGKRAELNNGKIYYMAPPTDNHQRISFYISRMLGNFIENNNGKCEVRTAPYGVFLNAGDKTYYEPDISVICDTSKIREDGCHGAPDLVIEILSKSTSKRDYGEKLFSYRESGVKEYWIVNPDKHYVHVYTFDNDDCSEYDFGEEIPVYIFNNKLFIVIE